MTDNKDTENMLDPDIIFKKTTNDYTLQIAKFEDNPENLFLQIKNNLHDEEIKNFNKIKNNKRKVEWLGTRILLKRILGIYSRIYYNTKGNPFLKTDKNISITHSENYVGIILSNHADIGIDTELISEKILRTAHKFIPNNILQDLIKEDSLEKIYLHWCGKETLFKIKGGGGYDFKENFIIDSFMLRKSGTIKTKIVKKEQETHSLSYKFINQANRKLLVVWKG